ncbi:peptidyl-prolyl cis-trans isomerase CYP21-4-like [Senna tora]|uniref:Peptidyl-prolyl cis-trans isomerase n=1 Tax=Senna tora TaxID=362788 RepID=A0A834SSC8_9FABA|nr:peptidyl-prolyl cis-trans isomerase CYP21-4-like [Senna tora]
MGRIKPQALLQQSKRKKGPSRISATTIVFYTLVLVLVGYFLFTVYRHWSQRSRFGSENHMLVSEGENSFVDSKKSELPGYAVLNTSKGSIVIELYKESAPEVVDEFIDLCQKGHFKGMLFNRVIKHYVIQAGDNQGTGATEDWNLRGKHYTSMKHEAFMLGTSKGKHLNERFDLFITTAPIPDLNEKLIVFGRVIKGEDVVQGICTTVRFSEAVLDFPCLQGCDGDSLRWLFQGQFGGPRVHSEVRVHNLGSDNS